MEYDKAAGVSKGGAFAPSAPLADFFGYFLVRRQESNTPRQQSRKNRCPHEQRFYYAVWILITRKRRTSEQPPERRLLASRWADHPMVLVHHPGKGSYCPRGHPRKQKTRPVGPRFLQTRKEERKK